VFATAARLSNDLRSCPGPPNAADVPAAEKPAPVRPSAPHSFAICRRVPHLQLFLRDIEPVAALIVLTNVMVVNPSLPATTVPEFIAYAKANPRKVNKTTTGTGTGDHIAGDLFKMMAGVDMVHVLARELLRAS
jgi:tripartite-type tricarboxylate transporter receptor subunit TctC